MNLEDFTVVQPVETEEATSRRTVNWLRLLGRTITGFNENNIPRLGAALAFYAAFSTTPVLLLAVGMSGFFFGEEAIRGQLKHELVVFVGADAAEAIQSMIAATKKQQSGGVWSSILGSLILIFGATGVFVELKSSMNTIWGIERLPSSTLIGMILDRLVSVVMVMGIAVLLVVSLFLSTAISLVTQRGSLSAAWIQAGDQLVSFILVLLLFAMMFKYLPDVIVQWEDVWLGALLTAVLFTLGKWLVASYFVTFATSTSYGAVGSMAVFLLWTYYIAQILLFGAEMTQAYAQMTGKSIVPTRHARIKIC